MSLHIDLLVPINFHWFLNCRVFFNGDTILKENPTNWQAAQRVMAELPKLANEATAITFYDISPLDKYCDERTSILNKLNEEKIQRAQQVLQEFDLVRQKINDLMDEDATTKYQQTLGKMMNHSLVNFTACENSWKQNFSIVLPQIR